MREISLDTETTGGNIRQGDRAVDIGLVELIDGRRTGKTWQTYLDPQGRKVHWGAQRIHGLSDSFLRGKPRFEDVADDMLAFIDGAPCVAHNARFDRDVIICEFHVCGLPLPDLRFHDSITMARDVLKTGSMSLDAIVTRLDLVTPPRKTHGALLDAEILALAIEALEARAPGAWARFMNPKRAIASLPTHLKQGRIQSWSAAPAADGRLVSNDTPPAAGTGLNPDVAENIALLNASRGIPDKALATAMRCGRDVWTDTDLATVRTVAHAELDSDVIDMAFENLTDKDAVAGLRWICRGLALDRYVAVKCFWDESLPQDLPDRVREALDARQMDDSPQP